MVSPLILSLVPGCHLNANDGQYAYLGLVFVPDYSSNTVSPPTQTDNQLLTPFLKNKFGLKKINKNRLDYIHQDDALDKKDILIEMRINRTPHVS